MLLTITIVSIIILTICDQLLKYWVAAVITLGTSKKLLPGVLELTNLQNTGAAWSLFEGRQFFFTVISIIAIVVISYFIWHYRHNRWMLVGLALIMAGTLGNFIDRLTRGYVVDMFATTFMNFPVFNLADSYLTVGVIWLIFCIIKEKD